jgi:hypothetical protein
MFPGGPSFAEASAGQAIHDVGATSRGFKKLRPGRQVMTPNDIPLLSSWHDYGGRAMRIG